jgi:hypothetical protein
MAVNDDKDFINWYLNMAHRLGLNPNPGNMLHFYDYYKAFKAGEVPTWQPEHQQFRWPDQGAIDRYKSPAYPYTDDYSEFRHMILPLLMKQGEQSE